MSQWFADYLGDQMREHLPDGTRFAYDTGPELLIDKHAVSFEVPEELLMDMGVIEDTRPPREPVKWPWRTRLHRRISDLRERAAIRAYCIISGADFPDDDSDR